MTDFDSPAADAPRKKADVWALEKRTPLWALAAARLVHAWPPPQLLSEKDFDDAITHVCAIACR